MNEKLKKVLTAVNSPAGHYVFLAGVLAYMRYTSGHWPTVDQAGAMLAVLIVRGDKLVSGLSSVVGLIKGVTSTPPAPPAPPAY